MFEVRMTINGKPATEANIKSELERSFLAAAIAGIKEKVTSAVTSEEARQLSIDVNAEDLDHISLSVSGPDEIVAKVKAALGD